MNNLTFTYLDKTLDQKMIKDIFHWKPLRRFIGSEACVQMNCLWSDELFEHSLIWTDREINNPLEAEMSRRIRRRPDELSAKGNTPSSHPWWPMTLSVFINDHKSDKIPLDRPKCRLSYETDGRSEIPKTEKSSSFVAEMVSIPGYYLPGSHRYPDWIMIWGEVNTCARYAELEAW